MKARLFALVLAALLAWPLSGVAQVALSVSDQPAPGAFALVSGGRAARIHIDRLDPIVVTIAADALAGDMELVTGVKPEVMASRPTAGPAVVAGTIERCGLIADLIERGKLDVSPIQGSWETYLIEVVDDPWPGVKQALVVAGSDRRGAAFGIFEVSRLIGVSPWVWWADAAPVHRDELFIAPGRQKFGPPSVKYRGIFINDEDFGLQPWSAKNFEPELGDIGPRSYARVFELLLRLRANHLWPAMHKCTHAFNHYPENKMVADDYAIVMGSSHCEQMLRNNVDEWKRDGRGPWWYQLNRKNILSYWGQRVQENGQYENIYTLGMRALHDSPIHVIGGSNTALNLLRRIITDQRGLIAQYVNPDVTQAPQVFVPYNEVQGYLEKGLEVPPDVTIMWSDDNHGYVRRLPTLADRGRAGGAGVYYHVSYWGPPHDYLWLCTTPPALIWEEMTKSYHNGAKNIWMLNVGDIKPAEIDMEFFLDLGWDIDSFGPDAQNQFLTDFARREFGDQHAAEISDIMNRFYTLNHARKPEHLGFNMIGEKKFPTRDPEFSLINYGDENEKRVAAFAGLERRATAVNDSLPQSKRASFYHLVLYTLRATHYMNQKVLDAHRSRVWAKQGRAGTNREAEAARLAYAGIDHETRYYNETLSGGKWRHMMSSHPKDLEVFKMPKTGKVSPPARSLPTIMVEGADKNRELPRFNCFTRSRHFFDLFNRGSVSFEFTARADDWIILSESVGKVDDGMRIWVEVDYSKAPAGKDVRTEIRIIIGGETLIVTVPVFNPAGLEVEAGTMVQDNGVIAIDAAAFASNLPGAGPAQWTEVPGLGRTGRALAILPFDAGAMTIDSAPVLEYPLYVFEPGQARLIIEALPTYAINDDHGLRLAVSIDDGEPMEVTLEKDGFRMLGFLWSKAVLSGVQYGQGTLHLTEGAHTLKVYGLDPSVVLDRIVLDFGGLKPSYLGPDMTVAH